MNEPPVEMREILLAIERDTMLDDQECLCTVNKGLRLCTEVLEYSDRDKEWDCVETSIYLNTFKQAFFSDIDDVSEQIEILESACNNIERDSLLRFVAKSSLAKLMTLHDTPKAASLFDDLLEIARNLHDAEVQVMASLRGARYKIYIGQYDTAFQLCFDAQAIHDKQILQWGSEAAIHYHLALCFFQYSSFQKALTHIQRALEIYREHSSHYFVAITLQVMANIYANDKSVERALECWNECASISEQCNFPEIGANVLTNMGVSFIAGGRFTDAHKAIYRAHELLRSEKDAAVKAVNLFHLALIYSEKSYEGADERKAEECFESAIQLAERSENKHLISNIFLNRYEHHLSRENWKHALEDYRRHVELEREVFTSDVELRVRSMEQEHERKLVVNEQRITSSLLHKVFPAAVVERMKHEQHIADSFDSVTVLFADIVGFTPLGSALSPRGVITLLNSVFSIFDSVMKNFGCEKIKTIGDGYMAVSGAPVASDDHAERMLLAACALLEKLKGYSTAQALTAEDAIAAMDFPLVFRIGIHCGPAVGGVVGEERFVYDLYGDTVNTAARMESHSDPGTIHVSDAVLHHLTSIRQLNKSTDEHQCTILHLTEPEASTLRFQPRGDVAIKGKGTMQTYFVTRV